MVAVVWKPLEESRQGDEPLFDYPLYSNSFMKQIFIQHLSGKRHYSMLLHIEVNKTDKCPYNSLQGVVEGDKG